VSGEMAQQDRSILFEPSARMYAAIFPKIWKYVVPDVQRWLVGRLRGRRRVLDAGTGSGHWLGLAAAAEPRSRLVGVDLSSAFLEIAGERLARTGAELHHADIAHMPFGDGEFDAIVCAGVLDTVPDPAAVFVEFRRLLAPDGVVLLVLRPGDPTLARAMEVVFRAFIGLGRVCRERSLAAARVPESLWRRTSVGPALPELCRATGLAMTEVRQGKLTTLATLRRSPGPVTGRGEDVR
jgi:ubiquinone/menaquinone biosynthesis C-methylase UbiE